MLPIIQTLGDRTVADMLARAQDTNVRARQRDAAQRVEILSDNWRELVWAYIHQRVRTPAVRQKICAEVKRTYNVLTQLATRVCVAYKVPPLRMLDGAPQSTQMAWAKLMAESGIATKAKAWERNTFALNVILVVPRVRENPMGLGKRLDYEMILPDRAEVYTDDRDPMGAPVRVVYWERRGSDREPDPMHQVVLDDQAWSYYDAKGRPAGRVEHGAGICPATVWRLDEPDPNDWWSSYRGSGIVDATLAAAYIAARRDWVRNGQDRRKEVLASENLLGIPQQVVGADGPMEIPMPPGSFSYQVLDAITSIDEFEKHLRAHMRQAAESIGVPSQLVDFDAPDNDGSQHSALADVRASHIEYYRRSEHELAWKTALVLRGMGHPSAPQLRPDDVLERFRILYPELTFAEAPAARLANAKERTALGLSSTFREYQREHPELTLAESREAVLSFAMEEGELNQFYIEHNISRDPGARLKTLAQLQGAQGGEASGEARNQQDDNEDDDPSQPGRADSTDDDSPDA